MGVANVLRRCIWIGEDDGFGGFGGAEFGVGVPPLLGFLRF